MEAIWQLKLINELVAGAGVKGARRDGVEGKGGNTSLKQEKAFSSKWEPKEKCVCVCVGG